MIEGNEGVAAEGQLRLEAIAAAVGLAIVGLSCNGGEKTTTTPPPPMGTLVLRFDHRIDDQPIAPLTEYTTRYGQQVKFDHLRYWVSNVVLRRGDDEVAIPASYYLVEITGKNTRTEVEVQAPPGTYDAVVFHLGVDPEHNKSLDLAEGELSAGIGMDWGWSTGYKFFRTEGTFVEQGVAGGFVIHTGNDVLYKELTAELVAPIEVVQDESVAIELRAEVDRIFAGVPLSKGSEIQGGTVGSLAGKIAGNYSRMFSLVTDDGLSPLTATSPNIDDGGGSATIPSDSTPPLLSTTVIDLPGALACGPVPNRPPADDRACFTPFLLGAGADPLDAGLYTFVTANGAPVRAPTAGIIADVVYVAHSDLTHSDLYNLSIRGSDDAAFAVDLRNVKALTVAAGDSVEAGAIVGQAGDYFDAGSGAVSLGVRRHQELVQRLCPDRYATAAVVDGAAAALAASNAAWPDLVHDTTCASPSIVCVNKSCEGPADFVVAGGDVDGGRRIYGTQCAGCHGAEGQGVSAPALCSGPACTCVACTDHATLAARIAVDMPPDESCTGLCADDVAAFILHDFAAP